MKRQRSDDDDEAQQQLLRKKKKKKRKKEKRMIKVREESDSSSDSDSESSSAASEKEDERRSRKKKTTANPEPAPTPKKGKPEAAAAPAAASTAAARDPMQMTRKDLEAEWLVPLPPEPFKPGLVVPVDEQKKKQALEEHKGKKTQHAFGKFGSLSEIIPKVPPVVGKSVTLTKGKKVFTGSIHRVGLELDFDPNPAVTNIIDFIERVQLCNVGDIRDDRGPNERTQNFVHYKGQCWHMNSRCCVWVAKQHKRTELLKNTRKNYNYYTLCYFKNRYKEGSPMILDDAYYDAVKIPLDKPVDHATKIVDDRITEFMKKPETYLRMRYQAASAPASKSKKKKKTPPPPAAPVVVVAAADTKRDTPVVVVTQPAAGRSIDEALQERADVAQMLHWCFTHSLQQAVSSPAQIKRTESVDNLQGQFRAIHQRLAPMMQTLYDGITVLGETQQSVCQYMLKQFAHVNTVQELVQSLTPQELLAVLTTLAVVPPQPVHLSRFDRHALATTIEEGMHSLLRQTTPP